MADAHDDACTKQEAAELPSWRRRVRRSRDLLIGFAVVFSFARLNRFAGGGIDALNEWPGRPVWYVSLVVLAVAAAFLTWSWQRREGILVALWIAASYLVWRTFEWGTVFDLGREPSEAPRSLFGRLFFVTGNDAADLWIRMTVGLMPGLVMGAFLARREIIHVEWRTLVVVWLGLGTAIWFAYVAAWELRDLQVIRLAELLAGSIWGMATLSAAGLRRVPKRA